MIGLVVPVYLNFEGFTRLMASVDMPVKPYVIPNYDGNIGVSAGWNQGLWQALDDGCVWCFVMNDDIVMEPGSMVRMIDSISSFDEQDNVLLVSAINTRDFPKEDSYTDTPDFSCFVVQPRQFISSVGTFDENFTPAYFEDNDMAYRITLAGGRAVMDRRAGMFHKGSVTQNWGGVAVVNANMFNRNKAYFATKWGGLPGQEVFTRPFDRHDLSYKDWIRD